MNSRGFTLIELLVALAVFSVLAVMSYQGLTVLARNADGVERSAARHRAIELALLRLERDLAHALPRAARGAYGDEQPALLGADGGAEWTVAELAAGGEGVGVGIRRVGYSLSGDQWRRRIDPVVDRTPRDSARTRLVLDGVERVSWRYVADGVTRIDQWPPRLGRLPPEQLPRAVEVRLVLSDWGEIVRLIELPDSSP
jgi:general secretion pathway protein J